MDELYSCADVAKHYGVEVLTVWDWIRKKKLPALKIGRDYRISKADMQAFEDGRKTIPDCSAANPL